MENSIGVPSRIYAIGDVDGYHYALNTLLNFIRMEAKSLDQPPVVYFLGNVVGSGPDSRSALAYVWDTLMQDEIKFSGSKIHLGENERWLRDQVNLYNEYGSSYYFSENDLESELSDCEMRILLSYVANSVSAGLTHLVDLFPNHCKLLRSAELYTQHDGFVFVHAGIDRSLNLENTNEKTATTISDGFVNDQIDDGRLVFHGHTPTRNGLPEVSENRINLNTNVHLTHRITCAVLDFQSREMKFLQTSTSTNNVITVVPDLVGEINKSQMVMMNPFSFCNQLENA